MSAISNFVGRVFTVISLLFFSQFAQGKVMEYGVDPENLGKGDWIYVLSDTTNKLGGNVESVTDVKSLLAYYQRVGMNFVAIKAGTGGKDFPTANPQVTPELIAEFRAAGIKLFPYTRSDGKDVPGEIALASKYYDMGADGFILDAEVEWETHHLGTNNAKLALELCEAIKTKYPNKFLGHAPLPVISLHSSFPYKEFGYYCDSTMPQAYWKSIGVTPRKMVRWMDEEWHRWHKSLSGKWTNAIKPLAPIGQGWNPSENKIMGGGEIMEFVAALNHNKNPATPGGYKGVSYWRSDLHTDKIWKGIKNANIGDPASTPATLLDEPEPETDKIVGKPVRHANDFVIDDSDKEVERSGPWQDGANAEGRHGSSYLTSNTDGELATITFRPLIRNRGEYDVYIWYSSHHNRTTRARWVISTENGATTNLVDQTNGGGDWYLLASAVSFPSGTNSFVSVSNETGEGPGHIVVADAVRFVRKEATPAIAADQTQPALSAEPTTPVAKAPSKKTPEPVDSAPPPANPNELIMDDSSEFVSFSGAWYPGKKREGRYGNSHMCANSSKKATATATYRPDLPKDGTYDIYVWYRPAKSNSGRAPWVINYDGGVITNRVNQTEDGGSWFLLGANLQLSAGRNTFVSISNETGENAERVVVADAVKFVRKQNAAQQNNP